MLCRNSFLHSHFGEFLLHRGWLRGCLSTSARAVFSIGRQTWSPWPQAWHRKITWVRRFSWLAWPKCGHVWAGVMRWHGQHDATCPCHLVFQLPP